MKKTFLNISIFITAFFALCFFVDESPLNQITEKLKKYTLDFPQEKIHIQTDKPYYIAGEEIWLKGYIVIASTNRPSDISKILHIELINEANEISKKITLNIDSGKTSGNLIIPGTLSSGNYRIRSYTNYMHNFDEDFFFDKFITIKNLKEVEKTDNSKSVKTTLKADFFPEGGALVYGIRSRVGVKITNQAGLGINTNGYIIDNEKQKVAILSTEHAGMGSFAINPIKGNDYKAVIEDKDGTVYTFNLPKILESGYNLTINNTNTPNDIGLKISASDDLINGQQISIIGQANGVTYYTSTFKLDTKTLTSFIPKKRFPTGIVQFTLFADSKPFAERIIFVNHNDQIKIKVDHAFAALVNIKKEVYLNGKLIALSKDASLIPDQTVLNLFITDYNDNPLDGNFSIAVIDADKVPFNEDDEVSILSNLLLSSDLKGYIEKPNYYFNPANNNREKYLDNLMLTQGWRRFKWLDLLTDKPIILTHRVEKTLEIAGLITDLKNKPIPNAKVVLISTTEGYNAILDTIANEDGKFIFDRLDVPDTVNFMLQAKTAKGDKNVKIIIDKALSIANKKYIGDAINMDNYISNAVKQYSNTNDNFAASGIKLNEVTINKKKELKPIVNVLHSKSRNGSADYVVSKERIENETGNAFNIFNSVPGVKMQNGEIIRAMANTVSIAPNLRAKPQPMIIILDGAKVEQDVLLTTPASAVEGIEVLVSNYNTMIYEDGYWGVIIITTKMGGSTKPTAPSQSFNVSKVFNFGLSSVKEFYEPDVKNSNTNSSVKAKINNLSSTIYWGPNIYSNVAGKATVKFQNIGKANYKVIIEGFDNFGNIGRKVYSYKLD